MFHRIIFLLLIVSSLSCNFNRCADCFQSFSEHRSQEYSKCRALNHFKIKINIINSLLWWSVTLLRFFQTFSTTRTTKEWPDGRIGDFGNFLNGLAKSPRVLPSSLILNECNLYCKIVKYCFLSKVCMIKTVPNITVSPQM